MCLTLIYCTHNLYVPYGNSDVSKWILEGINDSSLNLFYWYDSEVLVNIYVWLIIPEICDKIALYSFTLKTKYDIILNI
jgi:hypothetical protein